MSLILTVGGVTALLKRNVFIPIHRLRKYVESSEMNKEIQEPPPHLPHDLDIIAKSYYNVKVNSAGKEQKSEGSVK
jgi:hypothetical protein